MKHSYLILLFLFIYHSFYSQTISIPDAKFKNALIGLGVDTSGDGNIQVDEAKLITGFGESLTGAGISSLIGIEYFTNLSELWFIDNDVKTLNGIGLENLPNLTMINCALNQIENLDVSGMSNLQVLWCQVNPLESLNLGSLVNFDYLICDNTLLKVIDFSKLPKASSLIAENCALLEEIHLNNGVNSSPNLGDYVNFKNNPKLTYVKVDCNEINAFEAYINSINLENITLDYDLECIDLGIKKNDLNLSLEVFPNPSNGTLLIKTSELIEKILVYDFSGKKIKSLNFTSNKREIKLNINDFNIGVYFVKVISGNSFGVSKVIKK